MLSAMQRSARPRRVRPFGLSIVELLVGIAIGLFVLAGATAVVTGQLTDNRRLLLETQIQQDLRAAADLITRDLRRAGYWGNAVSRVWPAPGAVLADNMYFVVPMASLGIGGRTEINYSYSNAGPLPFGTGAENNNRSVAETYGFTHNSTNNTIDMKVGASGWQALTDPNVVRITQFDVQINPQVLTVPCAKTCPGGGTACWPQQTVRDVAIVITGQAVHDANVQRNVRAGTRLRNDSIAGACPV